MNEKIYIIIFISTYALLNVIRIAHNIKNKNYLISIYPEGIREKWVKVYEKPHIFFIQTSLVRILVIVLIIYAMVKYNIGSPSMDIAFGIIYYIAFVTIFDEIRSIVSQVITVKKLKENEKVEINYKEIIRSFLIAFPLIILIGLIPILFIMLSFSYFSLGCLFGGIFYILLFAYKILKMKRNNRKATAPSTV